MEFKSVKHKKYGEVDLLPNVKSGRLPRGKVLVAVFCEKRDRVVTDIVDLDDISSDIKKETLVELGYVVTNALEDKLKEILTSQVNHNVQPIIVVAKEPEMFEDNSLEDIFKNMQVFRLG